MKRLKTFPWHPFAFAAYPVLFLLAQNLDDMKAGEAVSPMMKALAATAVIFAGLAFVTKNALKTALGLSLFIMLFVSCGRLTDWLSADGPSFLDEPWRASAVAISLSAIVFAAGLYAIVKTRASLVTLTVSLNVAAAALLAVCAVNIAIHEAKALRTVNQHAFVDSGAGIILNKPSEPRNIYYIILDACSRSDNLKKIYGFDNGALLEYLRSKGFRIAENSRANYPYTESSLASSLNCTYLGDVSGRYMEDNRVPLKDMISSCRVATLLKGAGYRLVSFNGDEIGGADVCLPARGANQFEKGLFNTTAAATPEAKRAEKREEIRYAFAHLADTTAMQGPVFVYAHFMAPHPPFVFTRTGGDQDEEEFAGTGGGNDILSLDGGVTRKEYIERYDEQLAYVNTLLEAALDDVLARSKVPPIIIIQGDHGSDAFVHPDSIDGTYLADRMSIFNAYYLPAGGDKLLYDSITPSGSSSSSTSAPIARSWRTRASSRRRSAGTTSSRSPTRSARPRTSRGCASSRGWTTSRTWPRGPRESRISLRPKRKAAAIRRRRFAPKHSSNAGLQVDYSHSILFGESRYVREHDAPVAWRQSCRG
jgi:hypothetical protein